MNEFRIQNRYLIGLCDWLSSLQLPGQDSRERTKFVDLCIEKISEIEIKRKETIDKYVKKDEKGNWLKKEIEGRHFWDIDENKLDEFNKEFDAISLEEFVIKIEDGNKSKLTKVRDLVLKTDYKFGPSDSDPIPTKQYKLRLAADYDHWCEAFEKLTI